MTFFKKLMMIFLKNKVMYRDVNEHDNCKGEFCFLL